jgi:hypothetical protein
MAQRVILALHAGHSIMLAALLAGIFIPHVEHFVSALSISTTGFVDAGMAALQDGQFTPAAKTSARSTEEKAKNSPKAKNRLK